MTAAELARKLMEHPHVQVHMEGELNANVDHFIDAIGKIVVAEMNMKEYGVKKGDLIILNKTR
jgi:hypothetical protein